MFKKAYTLALLLLVSSLVLAACATPVEEEPAEEPAEEEPMEEEPMEEEPAEEPAEEEPMEEEPMEEEMMEAFPARYEGDCEASTISAIEAVDDYTVVFELCDSDPAFLEKAAFAAFAIQDSDYLIETGGTGALLDTPVGTGAYAVETWNRGDSIIYTRNDDYWGTPAVTETLVFRWSTEGAARLNELRAGTVDAIDNPSPDDFEAIDSDPDLTLIERPALNVFYFAMTNTFEPFDNIQVRQAIAQGIDRQRVVDNFYPGGSEVASHFTPCSIANGCAGDAWYDFDLGAAQALLAEAGYADGFETTIYYRDVFRSYLPEPSLVAVDLQDQLADLGITAEVVVMESGEFIAESTAGNLDGFYLLGWGADYPHVTNFLDFHFSANNPQFGDPHAEIFEPLAVAATIADPAESEPLYVEANNAIRELVPMVPIAHGGSAVAYRADVEGGFASPLGNEYFAVMTPGDRDTFVWMQNAEPISLYCGDETDGESLRACEQTQESLYAYEIGGTLPVPALATECVPNDDLSVWTCSLREGVTFHNGATFEAIDVVASWAVAWDFSNPYHVGNTGAFEYMDYLWGGINKPPSE